MRILIFVLLALNLLVFVGHFWSESPQIEETADNSALQLIAEKDLPEKSTVNDAHFSKIEEVKTPVVEKESAANSFPLPEEPENPPPQPPDFTNNCLLWNNLNNEEALQLQKMLVQRFAHLAAEVSGSKNGKWLVFIPPFPDSDSARERARSLKELDLDYFVLASGENKNAISLGVFRQEKTARQYFNDLQQKGVTDAVLQFKNSGDETGQTQIKVQARNENERVLLLESAQKIMNNKNAQPCK